MYLGFTTWPVLANAITVPVLPGSTGRRSGAVHAAEERGHSRASEEVAQHERLGTGTKQRSALHLNSLHTQAVHAM